jgi:hypothetical protein
MLFRRNLYNGHEGDQANWGAAMHIDTELLHQLHTCRLQDLREMATEAGISKQGNVESVRARLIQNLILGELDTSWEGIQEMSNSDIGEVLKVMGVKSSGAHKERRRRLWLHLNHDPKKLTVDSLAECTRDELHEFCVHLELARSGTKTQLFGRVAGVLSAHEGGWGKIKRSLKRATSPSITATFESIDDRDAGQQPALPSRIRSGQTAGEASTASGTSGTRIGGSISNAVTSVSSIPTGAIESSASTGTETSTEALTKSSTAAAETAAATPAPTTKMTSEQEIALSADDGERAGIEGEEIEELDDWESEPFDDGTEFEQVESSPTPTTLDEGAGQALVTLQARRAELHALIREFLLLSDAPSGDDITIFIEDLAKHGFGVDHVVVRDIVFVEIEEMATRKSAERGARDVLPGTWRERRALRLLEEERRGLLDELEGILVESKGDTARARILFEQAASRAGLDLELPAISGRIHGLFDLQVSLSEIERDYDPVAHRRDQAIRVLFRRADEIDESAQRTLERIEQQVESLERVVETVIRRNDGKFGQLEQALFIRFLERRGWDANHPEVRPRLIAAAGVLASHMGYITAEEAPTLPSQLALDPDKVGDVIENLREVLSQFGRAPSEESALMTPEEHEQANEPTVDRARRKLDAADSVLAKLQRRTDSEQ